MVEEGLNLNGEKVWLTVVALVGLTFVDIHGMDGRTD
jgi:hypothetical protein